MSTQTSARAPASWEAAPSTPLADEGEPDGDWAVCCSGGGIRSATYCLGGLQGLDEGGVLGKAKWIVGVSGGSYIAASRALVADGLRRAGNERLAEGMSWPEDTRRAYARGTPEEDNLRNDTHYLAPDAKTVLVAILSLLLGSVLTCLIALAPLYALGHAWGWLLRDRGVLAWSGGTASASLAAWTWWLAVPALAAIVTLVLFLNWWATLASGSPGRGARRARWVGWAGAITAGLGVLMLAVPPVIAALYRSTGALGTVVHFFGIGGPGHWSLATLSGLIAAITAVARSSQKQLAKVSQSAAAGSSSSGSTGQSSSIIGKLVTSARGTLTPWLATFVILAIGAFATLLWIGTAARVGYSPSQLWPVLIAVAVLFATRAVVDVNRTSLHDFYRWRLADAYAVTRAAAQAREPALRQKLFAKAAATRLSELQNQGDPALVIACTANINVNREVPAGRGGFCLAFDHQGVTLRGDPRCGERDVTGNTTDYEHLLGHTRFTLFDIVAISGAAFSPLMGAATRGAYRVLLTLTNLRLGVWMPHPDVVDRARKYLDAQRRNDEDSINARRHRAADRWWTRWTPLLLLWYVSPHPFWPGDPETQERREAWLWARVLELREAGPQAGRRLPRALARLQAAACWRVMQPTLGLLWAEAAGHTSYRATWINVTDGGHYDNLGLLEALRREANNIVVLDASGDSAHSWFTLGGAMALARSDAEVDIALDPSTMVHPDGDGGPPSLGKGQVLRPWANGTFTRSNGHGDDGNQTTDGNLWVCKLGWWDGAPWDVRAYAAGHPAYPCDPTLQQLYDGAEFDAYHELGLASVAAALASWPLPQEAKQRSGSLAE